jgi:hypothetical protein
MATAIVEQIAQAIATQLATITTDNGYALTVSEVLRPTRLGIDVSPDHYGIVLLAGQRQRETEYDRMGNPPAIAWRQTWSLDLCLRVSDDSTTPIDQLAHAFETEVIQAVFADRTWGGIALDTQYSGVEYLPAGEAYEGMTLLIDTIYRTEEDDPSSRI